MPIAVSTDQRRLNWRVDGVFLQTFTFQDGKVRLRVEMSDSEAVSFAAVCRMLVDKKAGRVVECQMPIWERHDGRLALEAWGSLPKDFEIAPIGSVVRLVVSLNPYFGVHGWRVTAFPVSMTVLAPAESVMPSKPEPKPSQVRYEPREPGPRHQGIPAPEAPEPAPGSVSQRAVLAIVPKPGLLRSSKPGSMPRPVPGLQPGRRRELYAAPPRR